MKKFMILGMAAAILAVSCNENENGGGTSNLTPEDNRAKMEQVALDAVSLASADKQQQLIQIIDEFIRLSCEYDLDFVYDDSDDSGSSLSALKPMNALLQPLSAFCKTSDMSYLTKATYEYSYIYQASRAYGIYEYADRVWTRQDSDEMLSFRFPYDGETVEATIKTSGQEYSFTYTESYTDHIYGPNGESTDETYIYDYNFIVPAKVEATITSGTTQLLSLNIDSEYNEGTSLKQSVNMTAGSYNISQTINLTDSNLSFAEQFTIDGQNFLSSSATVKGSNMCNRDIYEDYEGIQYNFTSATAKASVLDLNVTATTKADIGRFVTELLELVDIPYYSGDPENLDELPLYYQTDEYCKEICDLVNSSMTVTASYNNDAPFAELKAKSRYSDGFGYYDYYYDEEAGWHTSVYREYSGYVVDFILKFNNDGAEFLITEYFDEEDYPSVEKAIKDLINRYKYYLNYTIN